MTSGMTSHPGWSFRRLSRDMYDEVTSFAEKKKQATVRDDDEEWRETIRRETEAEIDRRVREALETPPGEKTRKARGNHGGRTLQELEQLNSHIHFDLTSREKEYFRNQKWKLIQERQRLNIPYDTTGSLPYTNRKSIKSLPPDIELFRLPPDGMREQGSYACRSLDNYYGSRDLKTEEYYAHVTNKVINDFRSLSEVEKHEFYYGFTKNGFKDAIRRGTFPDGSELTDLGDGKYSDKFGIVRDDHGPFWPGDYGPLHPTPHHERVACGKPEPLTFCIQDRSRRTVENQVTGYQAKWHGTQVVYDSERSNRCAVSPAVPEGHAPSLEFESRFECGNLRQARRVGEFEYELILQTDLYTRRHTQWFYFRVKGALQGVTYKFRILNLLKKDSLYNHGMRPLLYSERESTTTRGRGWRRTGHHISYHRNVLHLQAGLLPKDMTLYLLEWQMEFPHAEDTCYLAHCYPYTYTDLRNDLDQLLSDPERSKVTHQDVLCETRAGNSCFLLTVTNFDNDSSKRGIVVTARVHPGETNSSWMMKGLLDFITSQNKVAKGLRDRFVFKIVPMLNPDGVIVGNYRCSLAARDLNRNYRHPRRQNFPTIWHTKNMMESFSKSHDILLYCDLHGHSRKQNVFMYGCNHNNELASLATENFIQERLFPWLMSQKAPDRFCFPGCKFQIKKCKEATGRVVMFRQLNIHNSYTMEATFCGTDLNRTESRHFSIDDFTDMGRIFGETVFEYQRTIENSDQRSKVILELTRALTQQMVLKHLRIPSVTSLKQGSPNDVRITEITEEKGSVEKGVPDMDEKVMNSQGQGQNKVTTQSKVITKPSSGDDVDQWLSRITSGSVESCLRVLEQLNMPTIDESEIYSSSSDSDSESEPEMKMEPKSRKKKKKHKKKQKNNKDGATKERRKSDSSLPTIENHEVEPNRQRQKRSMEQYVKKFNKAHPGFVNRYSHRSNGGIPCFSEERSLERATKFGSDTGQLRPTSGEFSANSVNGRVVRLGHVNQASQLEKAMSLIGRARTTYTQSASDADVGRLPDSRIYGTDALTNELDLPERLPLTALHSPYRKVPQQYTVTPSTGFHVGGSKGPSIVGKPAVRKRLVVTSIQKDSPLVVKERRGAAGLGLGGVQGGDLLGTGGPPVLPRLPRLGYPGLVNPSDPAPSAPSAPSAPTAPTAPTAPSAPTAPTILSQQYTKLLLQKLTKQKTPKYSANRALLPPPSGSSDQNGHRHSTCE